MQIFVSFTTQILSNTGLETKFDAHHFMIRQNWQSEILLNLHIFFPYSLTRQIQDLEFQKKQVIQICVKANLDLGDKFPRSDNLDR